MIQFMKLGFVAAAPLPVPGCDGSRKKGSTGPGGTASRMRPDRFFAVVLQHQLLHELPIGKDAAFHPGIAKIKTKGVM